MLSQNERKALNTEFYTALGLMMQGQYAASGKRIRWTNYKTGIRSMYVRMDVTNHGACFAIELQHRDPEIRSIFWEQLVELKLLLRDALGDGLVWQQHLTKADGTQVSRVENCIATGSIFDKSTWPALLGFLKAQLIAFDIFWADVYDLFKALDD